MKPFKVSPAGVLASLLAVAVVVSAPSTRAESDPQPKPLAAQPSVGMFLNLEWRVMGLAEHLSHGPAFAVGATFLDGALRLGLGGLSRPGPLNPASFDVTLPDGGTYKGQSTLALRSDGAMAGLHVGLSQRLPFEPRLAVQIPVTVGYGGFGYYLSGADRDTPDGRRVSVWEDELFNGKDSFLGLVVDAGLRLRYESPNIPWLLPYAGAAFTVVPGFNTLVRRDYLGVSGSVGVEMGLGM